MRNMKELVGRLLDAGVEFVVVGGFAAVTHGSTRLTQDIDLCASFDPENLQRAIDALRPVQPRPSIPVGEEIPQVVEESDGFVSLHLETDAGDLELHSGIAGEGGFAEVRRRSIEVGLWGREVRVIDLDALIDAKRALKRPKDLEVLSELEEIRRRTRGG